LTPHATCGRLAKRRNPDQSAKCALLVNIQGPSLAEADLNALGIGGCAWAEPILRGSALAFLTLGTLFQTKYANPGPTESGPGWRTWSPGQDFPTTLVGMHDLLSLPRSRESSRPGR
jgi:hypothetical protein